MAESQHKPVPTPRCQRHKRHHLPRHLSRQRRSSPPHGLLTAARAARLAIRWRRLLRQHRWRLRSRGMATSTPAGLAGPASEVERQPMRSLWPQLQSRRYRAIRPRPSRPRPRRPQFPLRQCRSIRCPDRRRFRPRRRGGGPTRAIDRAARRATGRVHRFSSGRPALIRPFAPPVSIRRPSRWCGSGPAPVTSPSPCSTRSPCERGRGRRRFRACRAGWRGVCRRLPWRGIREPYCTGRCGCR